MRHLRKTGYRPGLTGSTGGTVYAPGRRKSVRTFGLRNLPGHARDRSDGSARRESFRYWAHAALQPLVNRLEAEFRAKLEMPVTLDLAPCLPPI